jgi:hypothetical protein
MTYNSNTTMRKLLLAIALLASASIATMAEDFKTLNGKEYKNATISRVEPDGIALIAKTGVLKIYFTELPKEVQQRFHYDPVKAAEFNMAIRAALAQFNVKIQQEEAAAKEKAEAAKAQQERAQWEPQIAPRVSSMQSIGGG